MSDAAALVAGLGALALLLSKRLKAAGTGILSKTEVQHVAEMTVARFYPAVDARMLVAMAEIESSFDPNAFRPEPQIQDASAGLMQTLLTTARWLYSDIGARAYGEPSPSRLTDPEISMYFGAAYVNWLKNYAGQARSERWIVESYNGGPGNSNTQTRRHYQKYLTAKNNY